MTKVRQLQSLASERNAIIMCLTETHLSSSNGECEAQMDGWASVRADRSVRIQGGAIIYVRNDLPIGDSLTFSNSYCEVAGSFLPNQNIAVITVYRPPGCPSPKFKEAMATISEWIEKLEQTKPVTVVLTGDFNLPFMGTWSNCDEMLAASHERAQDGRAVAADKVQAIMLAELTAQHLMAQCMKEGTRLENILDLLFASDPDIFSNIQIISNVSFSDHTTNVAEINIVVEPRKENVPRNFSTTGISSYNFETASDSDWASLEDELKTNFGLNDWSEVLEADNVDLAAKALVNKIESAVISSMHLKADSAASVTKEGLPFRSSNLIPRQIRTLLRRKSSASKAMKTTKSVLRCLSLRNKIAKAEEELADYFRAKDEKEEALALAKIKTDPKSIFKLIKRKQAINKALGPFLENNKVIPGSAANILRKQYESVFTVPREDCVVSDPDEFFRVDTEEPNLSIISNIFISKLDMLASIAKLSSSSAAGPDGVPASLIKRCSSALAQPLADL
jgi:hypothetical protein